MVRQLTAEERDIAKTLTKEERKAREQYTSAIGTNCQGMDRTVNTNQVREAIKHWLQISDKNQDHVLSEQEIRESFRKLHFREMDKTDVKEMNNYLSDRKYFDRAKTIGDVKHGISVDEQVRVVAKDLAQYKKANEKVNPTNTAEMSWQIAGHAVPPMMLGNHDRQPVCDPKDMAAAKAKREVDLGHAVRPTVLSVPHHIDQAKKANARNN